MNADDHEAAVAELRAQLAELTPEQQRALGIDEPFRSRPLRALPEGWAVIQGGQA